MRSGREGRKLEKLRAMGAAVQQSESLDLNQIQTFLAGCEAVAFTVESRAAKYALVDAVLRRHHYAEQSR